MKRGEQQADGDTDRFLRVIRRFGFAIFRDGRYAKHDYQVRGDLKKGLVFIGAERRQPAEPFFAHPAMVAFEFLFLSGDADLRLYLRIADDDEPPRLHVCSRRGRSGGRDRGLDQPNRNFARGKIADRPAAAHQVQETGRPLDLLIDGPSGEIERNELGLDICHA